MVGLKILIQTEIRNFSTHSQRRNDLETNHMAHKYDFQTGRRLHNWTPGVDRPGYRPFNDTNRHIYQYGNSFGNEDGLGCSDVNNAAMILLSHTRMHRV